SDFYFQKALIEYRIILDEYDHFKLQYCETLKEKELSYSRNSLKVLEPLVAKLKNSNYQMFKEIQDQLNEEFKVKEFERFEYWADHPFRTSHKTIVRNSRPQAEL